MLDGELHLLLGELNDDVSGYRRREATWISVIVHVVIILLLLFLPKLIPSSRSSVVHLLPENETPIFMPSQRTPKVPAPPTNKISDQNNRAQTRTPQPNRKTLRDLADARRPGPRQPVSPPAQQQPAPQMQASQAPQAGSPPPPQPPQQRQTAKLEAPQQPKQNPFSITSAGSSVDQAIHSAAANRGSAGVSFGGDYGSGIRPKVDTRGAMEILSDTRGVDFGPYMKRLHLTVEEHWYPLIPEVALPPITKRGRVIIEFSIKKDGTITGLRIVDGSGDSALDRAAYGALTNSNPLPRLPVEFSGDYLQIRAAFYYNPDTHQFE